MAAVSDEYGENAISEMEKGFDGKWSPNMLADCSWSLIRATSTGEYKRQKKRK
jgi:hypothetical protein